MKPLRWLLGLGAIGAAAGDVWSVLLPLLAYAVGAALKLLQARHPGFRDGFIIPAIAVVAWILDRLRESVPALVSATGGHTTGLTVHAGFLGWLWRPLMATALAVLLKRLEKDAEG